MRENFCLKNNDSKKKIYNFYRLSKHSSWLLLILKLNFFVEINKMAHTQI